MTKKYKTIDLMTKKTHNTDAVTKNTDALTKNTKTDMLTKNDKMNIRTKNTQTDMLTKLCIIFSGSPFICLCCRHLIVLAINCNHSDRRNHCN